MARRSLLRCMTPGQVEAGVDEAGRGCLAGPVAAAAVVWDPAVDHPLVERICDSKRLSPAMRDKVREFIEAHAVAWSVHMVSAQDVDRLNILRATFGAMHGALDGLGVDVDAVLVDGDRFREYVSPHSSRFVPHTCVVEGDNTYVSIAAASILAKTHRDQYVREVMHPAHPAFQWDGNKGYGSAHHITCLRRLGPTPFHRCTFAPVRSMIECDAAECDV